MLKFITALLLFTFSTAASSLIINDISHEALEGGILIDFDSYQANKYLNNFTEGNVEFINNRQNSGNYFSTNAFLQGTSGRDILLYGTGYIEFEQAVSAFSFSLGALNDDWEILALDGNGTILEKIDIQSGCCAVGVYGIAQEGIKAIKLHQLSNSLDTVIMDNFISVSISPVPIPSSLYLMGSALFIVYMRKKYTGRKHKKS